ncbi:hypothetical protein [Demequina sp.]|uniref:hypothetical protein n=1 Tax=Demequina sp. TaxID=2050685 RepID=UPI003A83BA55
MDQTTGAISRRGLLVGTAWATPAVIIATGIPARAASGGTDAASLYFVAVTGGSGSNPVVTFDGASTTQVRTMLTWSAGANPDPGPVHNIVVKVRVRNDTSLYPNEAPTNVSTGWVASPPTDLQVDGVWHRQFKFTYGGAPLNKVGDSTTVLEATLSRYAGDSVSSIVVTEFSSPDATSSVHTGPTAHGDKA